MCKIERWRGKLHSKPFPTWINNMQYPCILRYLLYNIIRARQHLRRDRCRNWRVYRWCVGVDQVDAGVEICAVTFSMTSFSCVTTAGRSVKGIKTRGKQENKSFVSLHCFETILKHYISHLCNEEHSLKWS